MQTLHEQKFRNGEVHQWYRIILGFSDHLVDGLLSEFKLQSGANVLDPFCGSGTTLVECMKRGINAWGLDANPSSCFAARVKTTWSLNEKSIREYSARATRNFRRLRKVDDLKTDTFYKYLRSSGMINRGWITRKSALDAAALKRAITGLRAPQKYRDILLLATANELVNRVSNVKFGPELYCSKTKTTIEMVTAFAKAVDLICEDLSPTASVKAGRAQVLEFDSRAFNLKSLRGPAGGFDAIITSPPYPTEHDYTRNSRLELAFFEAVYDRDSLRRIKKQMIRSHTKGLYMTDNDRELVCSHEEIQKLALEVSVKAQEKTHGFARLYSTVVKEYFGGMKRHFECAFNSLREDGLCAYVVGDQASYLQVPISTAKLLASIAEEVGFTVVEIRKWRDRISTTSRRYLDEHILILKKPPIKKNYAKNQSS